VATEHQPLRATPGSAKFLGLCWVIYGVLRLAMAIWLVLFTGTATVMFGALLGRVPNPFVLMGWFHMSYALAIVISALAGIFGLLGGVTLLSGARAGRMLLLVAAFLSLSEIPLGLTLGVYTLVVFLRLQPRDA
jgi:hypothetical protein